MSDEKNGSVEIVNSLQYLPINKLKEFKNHPFKKYEGERLDKLVASIKKNGILVPIIVRPYKMKTGANNPAIIFDEYEILSGHNRVEGSKIAGLDKILAEIRDVDDEQAIAIVNATNIQQRNFKDWLPSEKAESIFQYHESIRRQGERSDLQPDTSPEVQEKWDSQIETAKVYGVKKNIIEKYLNLNKLIEPLKERLNKKEFGEIPAMNISYLSAKTQKLIHSVLKDEKYKLNLKIAESIKSANESELTAEKIKEIFNREKSNNSPPKSFTLKSEIISKYFSDIQPEQLEAELIKALELYRSQNISEENIQNDSDT